MCVRCIAVDKNGYSLPVTRHLECSWCESGFGVCAYAAQEIDANRKSKLCQAHHNELMSQRAGDFKGAVRRYSDEEYDADANGWLSNAIRLLDTPVERPLALGEQASEGGAGPP